MGIETGPTIGRKSEEIVDAELLAIENEDNDKLEPEQKAEEAFLAQREAVKNAEQEKAKKFLEPTLEEKLQAFDERDPFKGIKGAKNFNELFTAISGLKGGGIEGSAGFYPSEELVYIIGEVQKGKQGIDVITREGELRKKVLELLENEKQTVFQKNQENSSEKQKRKKELEAEIGKILTTEGPGGKDLPKLREELVQINQEGAEEEVKESYAAATTDSKSANKVGGQDEVVDMVEGVDGIFVPKGSVDEKAQSSQAETVSAEEKPKGRMTEKFEKMFLRDEKNNETEKQKDALSAERERRISEAKAGMEEANGELLEAQKKFLQAKENHSKITKALAVLGIGKEKNQKLIDEIQSAKEELEAKKTDFREKFAVLGRELTGEKKLECQQKNMDPVAMKEELLKFMQTEKVVETGEKDKEGKDIKNSIIDEYNKRLIQADNVVIESMPSRTKAIFKGVLKLAQKIPPKYRVAASIAVALGIGASTGGLAAAGSALAFGAVSNTAALSLVGAGGLVAKRIATWKLGAAVGAGASAFADRTVDSFQQRSNIQGGKTEQDFKRKAEDEFSQKIAEQAQEAQTEIESQVLRAVEARKQVLDQAAEHHKKQVRNRMIIAGLSGALAGGGVAYAGGYLNKSIFAGGGHGGAGSALDHPRPTVEIPDTPEQSGAVSTPESGIKHPFVQSAESPAGAGTATEIPTSSMGETGEVLSADGLTPEEMAKMPQYAWLASFKDALTEKGVSLDLAEKLNNQNSLEVFSKLEGMIKEGVFDVKELSLIKEIKNTMGSQPEHNLRDYISQYGLLKEGGLSTHEIDSLTKIYEKLGERIDIPSEVEAISAADGIEPGGTAEGNSEHTVSEAERLKPQEAKADNTQTAKAEQSPVQEMEKIRSRDTFVLQKGDSIWERLQGRGLSEAQIVEKTSAFAKKAGEELMEEYGADKAQAMNYINWRFGHMDPGETFVLNTDGEIEVEKFLDPKKIDQYSGGEWKLRQDGTNFSNLDNETGVSGAETGTESAEDLRRNPGESPVAEKAPESREPVFRKTESKTIFVDPQERAERIAELHAKRADLDQFFDRAKSEAGGKTASFEQLMETWKGMKEEMIENGQQNTILFKELDNTYGANAKDVDYFERIKQNPGSSLEDASSSNGSGVEPTLKDLMSAQLEAEEVDYRFVEQINKGKSTDVLRNILEMQKSDPNNLQLKADVQLASRMAQTVGVRGDVSFGQFVEAYQAKEGNNLSPKDSKAIARIYKHLEESKNASLLADYRAA